MRRAAAVALLSFVCVLVLGLLRAGSDIDEETRAAVALAESLHALGDAQRMSDAELLRRLGALQREGKLRHLLLRLTDAKGRVLADAPVHEAGTGLAAGLVWLHAAWPEPTPVPSTLWPIARPDGSLWTLEFAAAPESERREAMEALVVSLLLVAAGLTAMLLVMGWSVRRALRPLHELLAGIGRLEYGEPGAIAALPAMPIQELQVIATALRRLDAALVTAERERRMLGQKVLTLQEDERQGLARELHDEFGQRLTALRVDAAWLRRRVAGNAQLAGVVDGMAAQCQHIQQDIRSLLTRLRPLGPDSSQAGEPVGRLPGLLDPLVRAWSREDADASPRVTLHLQAVGADGAPTPWPADNAPPNMPRELQVAIYRISQEALTNVARHAGAGQALLQLTLRLDSAGGTLDWCLRDDGVGLDSMAEALQRGSGLAGMRERAWVQGADLRVSAASDDAQRPGLMLQARFAFEFGHAAGSAGRAEARR